MIVLLKSEDDDYFVNITEWLNHFKANYYIIDLENISINLFEIHFKNNSLTISINHNKFNCSFDEVSTFFYRSGEILIKILNESSSPFNLNVANLYLQLEQETLIDFIYSEIRKKSFGYIERNPLNKLKQLRMAQEFGLKIPETLITSNKETVNNIFKASRIVNKAIQENIFTKHSNVFFIQRVEEIENKKLKNNYSSSLFQSSLDKLIEIRTFFLINRFYSIGFYSSEKSVDMRETYSFQNHFKIILPEKIEQQLTSLMNRLNLLSGSIDLILSKNGDYYFLEINTQGQYDWVSKLGGYNLDFLISEHLINRENEYIRT